MAKRGAKELRLLLTAIDMKEITLMTNLRGMACTHNLNTHMWDSLEKEKKRVKEKEEERWPLPLSHN